jgi:hypothetical protein
MHDGLVIPVAGRNISGASQDSAHRSRRN